MGVGVRELPRPIRAGADLFVAGVLALSAVAAAVAFNPGHASGNDRQVSVSQSAATSPAIASVTIATPLTPPAPVATQDPSPATTSGTADAAGSGGGGSRPAPVPALGAPAGSWLPQS